MSEKNKIEWSILQSALIIFVISLITSVSIIWSTWYYKTEMHKKFNQTNGQFQTISNKYLAIDQEEKLIRDYYPKFIELYENGLLGPERRLNWIEALRESSEKLDMPNLSYDIQSQIQYKPEYSIKTGSYKLYISNMKLSAELYHIVDFFRFLNELKNNAQGVFDIKSCDFKRRSEKFSTLKLQPILNVECEFSWLNIKKSNGSDITFEQS